MRSPLHSYIGGKSRLARKIIAKMPPHDIYVEPFCGSAAVFFRKPKAGNEVLNDLNGDVINFFAQLRDNLAAFQRRARYRMHSRMLFNKYRAEPFAGLSDLERAYRYWYLIRTNYGGRMVSSRKSKGDLARRGWLAKKRPLPGEAGYYNPSFGYTRKLPYMRKLPFNPKEAEAWWERLQDVTLECDAWHAIIPRYDSEAAFFYLDPPYYDCEGYYGMQLFDCGQYALMAEMLRGIKGKFLLSLNDRPEMREIFAGFHMESISVYYSINDRLCAKGRRSRFAELLISNYELPDACGQAPLPGRKTETEAPQ